MHHCMLCNKPFDGDEQAFNFHVNRCLDEKGGGRGMLEAANGEAEVQCPSCQQAWKELNISSQEEREGHAQACLLQEADSQNGLTRATQSAIAESQDAYCPVCLQTFDATENRLNHVNRCLGSQQDEDDGGDDLDLGTVEMDKKSSLSESPYAYFMGQSAGPSQSKSKANAPVVGRSGLFPIIVSLLEKSHATSKVSSAVVCNPNTIHTYVGFGDVGYGWACGYLCFQMLFSSARFLQSYQPIFTSSSSSPQNNVDHLIPPIRATQQTLETAWAQGMDPEGARHFKGKLVNKRNWIGTTEVYTAFTFMGFKTRIYDFPEVDKKGTHTALIRWVRNYFEADALDPVGESDGKKRQRDAFDSLMGTHGATVRQTSKQPLFLQHDGHSRVVIGIEEANKGDEASLLVFDPGSSDKRQVLEAAVAYSKYEKDSPQIKRRRSDNGADVASTSAESPDPASGFSRTSVTSWLRSLPRESSSDVLDLNNHNHLLKPYRMSLAKLSRNKQYQILYVVPNHHPLSAHEKNQLSIPQSVRVE